MSTHLEVLQESSLSCSEDLPGRSVLDLPTGTGHVGAAVAGRCARTEGVHFAQAMVDLAHERSPGGLLAD